MSEDPPYEEHALVVLSQFLLLDSSLHDTVLHIAVITQDALPAAHMAGVSMMDEHGKPATTVYTDEESPEIDASQYESGRGPCLDAWRSGKVVRLDDMNAASAVYPEFARAALEHGVKSTISLPLANGETAIGALNLYARMTNGFGADDEQTGVNLAAAASIVLANATAYWSALERNEQMTEAMRSRAVIEQAKGILMGQTPGLSADDAFEVLVKASQRQNVKLRTVAQGIVDLRGRSAER